MTPRGLAGLVAIAACGGSAAHPVVAVAPPTNVTIRAIDQTGGGHEAALAAPGPRHQAELDHAAGSSAYELVVTLTALDATDQIACKVSITVQTTPGHDLVAAVNGAAEVAGTDDTAANDCIRGVVDDLLGKVPTAFANLK